MKKILSVLVCVCVLLSAMVFTASADNATSEIVLTVDSLGLASQSYSASTATVGGADFEWIQLGNYGDGIQVRDKNGNTSSFWNTAAFSAPIKEIKLVYSSSKDVTYANANAEIFSFGTEAGSYTYETKLSTEAGVKEYTITPDAETYTYLKFEHDLGYTMYWNSITIVLAGGSSSETPDVPVEPETPVVPDAPVSSEIALTVDSLGLGSQSYSASTATVGGADFEWIQLGNYGDGIQVRDKNGNTSTLWNTAAFSAPIKEIKLVYSSTKDVTYANADAEIFSFGTEAGAYTYSTKLSTEAGVKEYTITPDAETYTYFHFEHDLGYTMYWDSITIVLAGGATGGETPEEPEEPDVPDTPVEIPEKTIAEVLAMADSADKFIVTAEIVDTYRDTWATYGNFILKDDSTDETIIMYGLNDENGNRYDKMETKPVVGDTVKVQANRSSYNGVGQLANAILLEIVPTTPDDGGETPDVPTEPEKPDELPAPDATNTLTIKEALELGASKEHNTYTDEKYYVTGLVLTVYNTQYGNMYIADEEGNTLTLYGTYSADGETSYGEMESKPDEGDTVTIYGKVGQYSGTAQIKNGWIIDFTAGELDVEDTDPEADSVLSIKDAIALGESKLHNVYTENKYYVTGTILEVYNEDYGNLYLVDDEGNQLTVYGSWNEDGTLSYSQMENKPVAGDTVTLYGIIGQYNGVAQMKNGWFKAAPAVEGGDDTTNDDTTTDGTTNDTTTGGTTNDTTSPVTGNNVGSAVAMAIAAGAVILYTSKKR